MSDQPNAVMIFAAGFGARMKHLTQDRPKPLVEVAGRALIDHALDIARDAGFERIVSNLHYKADMLETHLSGTGVNTITESPDILETGGGLRNALPYLGTGPVATLNPDAIWQGVNPLALLYANWDPLRMDGLLACVPITRAHGHQRQGDFHMDQDGRLSRGPGVVYGGVQIIKTDRLASVAEKFFSLNVIYDQMIADGRLFGLEYPGHWCDVGHPESIPLAEELLRRDV